MTGCHTDRLGDLQRTSTRDYDCARLDSIARITVQETICSHGNSENTHRVGQVFKDCQNKFDCGIFVKDQYGGYSAVEDISRVCPAHIEISTG